MIVPAVGGLTGVLGSAAGNVATGSPEALAEGIGQSAGSSGAAGIAGEAGGTGTVQGTTESPNFGSTLTEAISSLEEGQQNAATASHALATGSVSDPEAAVTTVEDAALEMQLAAQIRTKATEAAQTIFQTQV